MIAAREWLESAKERRGPIKRMTIEEVIAVAQVEALLEIGEALRALLDHEIEMAPHPDPETGIWQG